MPSQWDTALLCNNVSNWLGASQKSALYLSHDNLSMLISWCVEKPDQWPIAMATWDVNCWFQLWPLFLYCRYCVAYNMIWYWTVWYQGYTLLSKIGIVWLLELQQCLCIHFYRDMRCQLFIQTMANIRSLSILCCMQYSMIWDLVFEYWQIHLSKETSEI